MISTLSENSFVHLIEHGESYSVAKKKTRWFSWGGKIDYSIWTICCSRESSRIEGEARTAIITEKKSISVLKLSEVVTRRYTFNDEEVKNYSMNLLTFISFSNLTQYINLLSAVVLGSWRCSCWIIKQIVPRHTRERCSERGSKND